MNTTRIFQAAAVVALALVLGSPAVASAAPLTAAKPPVAAQNGDMSWQ
ncbi:hypothetical protein ACIF8W_30545 [Streptomyces sp. NPDC085639]|nr:MULTISPECIES: hypothetical protein [Streptomyces]